MEIFPIILIEFRLNKVIESLIFRIVYNSTNEVINYKGHKSKTNKLSSMEPFFIRTDTNQDSYKWNDAGKYHPYNKIISDSYYFLFSCTSRFSKIFKEPI